MDPHNPGSDINRINFNILINFLDLVQVRIRLAVRLNYTIAAEVSAVRNVTIITPIGPILLFSAYNRQVIRIKLQPQNRAARRAGTTAAAHTKRKGSRNGCVERLPFG